MGQLYQTYMTGNDKTRELVVTEPLLVLRVEQQAQTDLVEASGVEVFISDLHALGALARRAYGCPPGTERLAAGSRARRSCLPPGPGGFHRPAEPMGERECSITPRGSRS